jgi:hypothetical protein
VRALLILTVLMAWLWCLAGAVGVPAYLATALLLARRGRPRTYRPGRLAIATFAAFAGAMGACAALLIGSSRLGERPAPWLEALSWGALPLWTALWSTAAALRLTHLRRHWPTGSATAPLPAWS